MNSEVGYIGLTDPDWYRFLASQPRVDEVNFWQPRGNREFRSLKPGNPFFFKLRAPDRAIAGFGFFERFSILPAWLAWESFGLMNGAADFEEMVARIARLRGGDDDGALRSGDFRIGCIMISAPMFFRPEDWVDPPVDWARTGIQQGKRYPLDSGEGKRVLLQCLDRAVAAGRYWNVETEPVVAEQQGRYGSPILVRPRMGQGLFSLSVRDAYRGACAVTSEHSGPVLEAAHIIPYSQGGAHRIENGLLLRSDLHRLFDRGYVTVTPDYRFRVGARLRDEFKNGRSYYHLDGAGIAIPERPAWQPKREFLDWHQATIFKG